MINCVTLGVIPYVTCSQINMSLLRRDECKTCLRSVGKNGTVAAITLTN